MPSFWIRSLLLFTLGCLVHLACPSQALSLPMEEEIAQEKINVTLTAKYNAQLTAKVVSAIKRIEKGVGDSFKQGDILLELDKELYEARFQAAKAMKEKAEVYLENKRTLLKDGISSLLQVKEAEAEFARAHLEYITAKENLESCTVIAPYDGRVTDVWGNVFEQVQVGQPMIKIIYDQILIAKFLVPSRYFSLFQLNKKIYIDLPEIGELIEATISSIDSVFDAASSTMRIFATIPNPSGRLRAGMSGLLVLHSEDVSGE